MSSDPKPNAMYMHPGTSFRFRLGSCSNLHVTLLGLFVFLNSYKDEERQRACSCIQGTESQTRVTLIGLVYHINYLLKIKTASVGRHGGMNRGHNALSSPVSFIYHQLIIHQSITRSFFEDHALQLHGWPIILGFFTSFFLSFILIETASLTWMKLFSSEIILSRERGTFYI